MYPNPLEKAQREFVQLIEAEVKESFKGSEMSHDDILGSITTPKSDLGDLSSSIAFKLAEKLKKNPHEIAVQIAGRMKEAGLIEKVSELNGYINAFLDVSAYSELVLDSVLDEKERYGMNQVGKNEKVIIEFPSVNPNKPWHVGHVRNAILGDVLSNTLAFCSYRVEREDYIDDLGLQIAESLWGWLNLDNKPDKKFDEWLGEQYVEVNERLGEPGVKAAINGLLKKLEDTSSNESKTAREVSEKCVMAQRETAFSYGIQHDVMIWESDVVRAKLLEKALEAAQEEGILEKPTEGKYAGATIIKLERLTELAKELEGSREDAKVITRSNGAATYIAKDFAFHMWKFGFTEGDFRYRKFIEKQPNGMPLFTTSEQGEKIEFGKVRRAINIIDSSQAYEQTIMRLMFTLMGYADVAENIVHLAYGKVNIEGINLSTRKGTWIGSNRNYTADDLLKETTKVARRIVSSSKKIEDKTSMDMVASQVALGAIRFEFLRISPEKEIVFSWDKALNFEGNSGPYCMYTYARATRVLEKSDLKPDQIRHADPEQISRDADFELVKLMGSFPGIVGKVCSECRPNVITDYLLELCSTFSRFYEKMPIIKGGKAKETRLILTQSLRQVLGNALRLLGITPIERM
jgi:arginyl-tRNA synthetase